VEKITIKEKAMQWIELDGAQGEGGGQILRTALTLSMIAGKPFRIANIRAKRSKPGLLRQHLTAVLAAAEICGAAVEGAAPGAQTLVFTPGKIKGGEVRAKIAPVKALLPLDLTERGALLDAKAVAVVAGLPAEIAKRELERIVMRLDPINCEMKMLPAREGPGNALMIALHYEQCSEVFTGFGEKGVPAETVADRLAKEARRYRDGNAAVGEHLADQLALPMALAGNSRLTATAASSHLRTNLEVIGKFLPVIIRQKDVGDVHWLEFEGKFAANRGRILPDSSMAVENTRRTARPSK
jgi:RNA 3'-terminal phosphate cyclase